MATTRKTIPTTELKVGDQLVLMAGTDHEIVTEVLELKTYSRAEMSSSGITAPIEWAGIRSSGTLDDQPDHEGGDVPTVTIEVEEVDE